MMNVYELVRSFYEENIEWQPVIKREWVEGYLRQKAWQGVSDDELQKTWRYLQMFETYLAHAETDYSEFLDAMPDWEYAEAIKWMDHHFTGFKKSLKPVRCFFGILMDFYKYLANRRIILNTEQLERAAEIIAGGRKVNLDALQPPAREQAALFDEMLEEGVLPELAPMIGEVVERLMNKLGSFFQQKEFRDDFHRALMLYAGPMITIPGEEQDEFWLGFWDYFLFDYHLIANDRTPLQYFHELHGQKLAPEERLILSDFINAKFCVFYVNRIVSQEWVECVNLFTEEKFELPYPDMDYRLLKRLIFTGHIFQRERTMINYVTSVEVSPKLRRRLREEVIHQKQIYELQRPGASWTEFLARHSAAVRHTINILTTLAKVNVTPRHLTDRHFPPIVSVREPNQDVGGIIARIMPAYGFSCHDIKLAQQLWHDYCQLTTATVRKPEAWAAAVIYTFAQINLPVGIPAEPLAQELGISAGSIYTNRGKLCDLLQLEKHDPRYLNEEGFVFSLFSS
ncbi:hypothetical protein [Sporolituus thermophilus]|uniref:Core-binding (CB) domain-containing protein n=1 Tax=Sporolituus thermophilus DSM 23256 TaxID=1123285 RepID=A0A1G7KI88_9FIRM|nr:hypothetical protein [Sporolituus thermophilus]SDF36730.1 hypothetical protein SAMN05660235_01346 [Sporolituus thermophilus DSM 23256]